MAAKSSWDDTEVVQVEGVSELKKLVTGTPSSFIAGKPTPPLSRERSTFLSQVFWGGYVTSLDLLP